MQRTSVGLYPPKVIVSLLALTMWAMSPAPNARAEPAPPAQKPAQKPAPKPAQDKSAASCTQVSGGTISEAYGYKHVVTLRNGCDKPVECDVWTDVDPTPRQLLSAQPGESVQVITRIGSPAREVKAFKECRFR